MYNRLQKQYGKLNQSIQKAMQTGRFYAYTQFKQQQLLSRLKRCSFQLKQLGAGVAVVGALAMATPAVGQYPYLLTEQTGAANPLDGMITIDVKPEFVDIDNDGDLDLFVTGYSSPTTAIIRFLENTGTDSTPVFIERTGSNNPLDGQLNKGGFDFVDIDGDGDMDCFSGNQGYYSTTNNFFYENTGNSSSPIFTLDSINNPLDSVKNHLNALSSSGTTDLLPLFSFVDIDGDGDMDCFVGVRSYGGYAIPDHLWYYENIGTSTTPNFIRKSDIDNPFSTVISYYSSNVYFGIPWAVSFADTDNDGDQDAVFGSTSSSWVFCENQGTSMNAVFDTIAVTPLDMATSGGYEGAVLVDINNDSKLDVFKYTRQTGVRFKYFLNETPTSISNLEIKTTVLNTFPNPTQGILFFDKEVTGIVNITNLAGQEVFQNVLSSENQLNLSAIPEGMYSLTLKLENNTIVSKIIFIES